MFHVKICGIRTAADLHAVADAGADAVGLNFFPPSVRYLDPEENETAELAALAKQLGLLRVAVVVNRSVESLHQLAQQVALDAIQLHGDETLMWHDSLRQSVSLPILRAIKLPRHPLSPDEISAAADPWIEAGCQVLLDADAGSQHGGSGKTLDWPSVANWANQHSDVEWTLAGGLTPDNVREAIQRSGAKSVDTASGVESPRGVKDPEKIKRFCEEAS